MEVNTKSFEEVGNPGEFKLLDHRSGTCMIEISQENEVLSKEITLKEKEMIDIGLVMRGRQYAKVFLTEFEQDERNGAMYSWEDLEKVIMTGNKVGDLRLWLIKWDSHLCRMKFELPEDKDEQVSCTNQRFRMYENGNVQMEKFR